jgi:hypothetical protein
MVEPSAGGSRRLARRIFSDPSGEIRLIVKCEEQRLRGRRASAERQVPGIVAASAGDVSRRQPGRQSA